MFLTPIRDTILKNELAGISIHPFNSIDDAVQKIVGDGIGISYGLAIAINAEKIVRATRDVDTLELLKSATFRYADGIGVVWALKRKGIPNNQIPGVELWEALMRRAAAESLQVFLIGGKPTIVTSTAEKLSAEYCGINIVGAHHGYFEEDKEIISEIKRTAPDIVCVAMGSPRQEHFMHAARQVHEKCFYMGVGGTFDVYTGNVKRAPAPFRRLGLEWFYRLCAQPTRIGRQLLYVQFVKDVLLGKI